jgi:hypothetical protein
VLVPWQSATIPPHVNGGSLQLACCRVLVFLLCCRKARE